VTNLLNTGFHGEFSSAAYCRKEKSAPAARKRPAIAERKSIGQEAAFRYGVWKSDEMYRKN
jgi:hypothetical protein